MSYIASHIGTVPYSREFKWYLIFLECEFEDEIRKEIDANFAALGKEVGGEVLVVRGYDPKTFRESVFAKAEQEEAASFYRDDSGRSQFDWYERAEKLGFKRGFPLLVVTNKVPSKV